MLKILLHSLAAALLLGTLSSSMANEPYQEDRPGDGLLGGVVGGPEKETAQDQFAYASALEQNGSLRKAGKAYRKLVAHWPDHDLAPDAQFRYARTLEQRDKSDTAFHAYQELLDTYPAGMAYDYVKVLDRQFEIASALKDKRKAKFLFFPGFKSPAQALELFEKVFENAPRRSAAWSRGPEVGYVLGSLHEEVGDYELAAAVYLDTVIRYPDSPYAEKAAFGRGRSLVGLSEDAPYDRAAAQQAYHYLSLFNGTYPTSEHGQDAGDLLHQMYERMAHSDFEVARFYDRHTSRPDAALAAYESFVDRFPASEYATEAKARIKALNEVVEDDRERR